MARHDKLLFELPFTLDSPRLTSEAVGISRLIQCKSGSFTRETTLVDSSDHRLLRAGVTLQHRVDDGVGEWSLHAPTWQPWLPDKHKAPLDASGDLPSDLAFLVRPFRRLAALTPVAAVLQERVSYAIEDDHGTLLATLRDERISIRRGGITTARFREAVLASTAAMTKEQSSFLRDALVQVGAVPVEAFPAPLKRLGGPSVGLTDFPEPRPIDKKTSLEGCVSSLFAARLRDIVRADLALRAAELVRQSKPDDSSSASMAPLLDELDTLRRLVHALAGVLQPDWRERLEAELDQVLGTPADAPVGSMPEPYYAVLDALITAARAPQLGDHSQRRAVHVLREQAEGGVGVLATRLHDLSPTSTDAEWQAALFACSELDEAATALAEVGGRPARRLAKQLGRLHALLVPAAASVQRPTPAELAELDGPTGYQLGLETAGAIDRQGSARQELLATWPDIRTRLLDLRGRR